MLISGEYDCVSKKTRHFDILRDAHRRSISRGDALALCELLRPSVAVKFIGYRGRAHIRKNAISLPVVGWGHRTNGGPGVGSLRVGIVLHELAHLRYGKSGHGVGFVACLDRLLEISQGLY
jgi:hypothetical protein